MTNIWRQREHDADLNLKRCYTWASKCPVEKDLLIKEFSPIWSTVRQLARAGKDNCATDDMFFKFLDDANDKTGKKIKQIPPAADNIAKYAIAYKWAGHPDEFDRLSETDFSPYEDESKRPIFLATLDALEKIAIDKLEH